MAHIIDGKKAAEVIKRDVSNSVEILKSQHGVKPCLAVVMVGKDPASEIYVKSKIRQCAEVGIESLHFRFDADIPETKLVERLHDLNSDTDVHGILVQLPLPSHIREQALIRIIDPAKDVDGFHIINSGLLATGGTGLVPCTPLGCLILLQSVLGDLKGKKALVIGRSNIVGKPMAMLLLQANCTITVAHRHTQNLESEVRSADIIVAAVGVPELIKGDWVKEGACVIDVGINRIAGPVNGGGHTRLVGDVEFERAEKLAGSITPVPGGVGPMTIACLLKNTIAAACLQNGLSEQSL